VQCGRCSTQSIGWPAMANRVAGPSETMHSCPAHDSRVSGRGLCYCAVPSYAAAQSHAARSDISCRRAAQCTRSVAGQEPRPSPSQEHVTAHPPRPPETMMLCSRARCSRPVGQMAARYLLARRQRHELLVAIPAICTHT
jgi:hypothetical protein